TSPQNIASELADFLLEKYPDAIIKTAGGYLNIFLDKKNISAEIAADVINAGENYGKQDLFSSQKIMIEFSCPNTNKPLHLGHMRNNILGESISRLFSFLGADVCKVNLINDRGIHICKSMLAYKELGNGETPESAGKKSDHFVGDYYVKFNQWASSDDSAEEKAREMLRRWENGDQEVMSLWKRMNEWAIDGINKTYKRTGISFDRVYYESQTYLLGKDLVLKGLDNGVFYKENDGSVWVDLSEIGLDKKVLLRKDGTSLYLTQDLGTAVSRHEDWPFERLIYVVASEQNYHFKVLFYVLKKLGYDWAENLYHLSYGMVNLPEGKMKSREGTVVDADNLLDQLVEMAKAEIEEKGKLEQGDDADKAAEAIALGALHYFLLQVSPNKDMIFDPRESISLTGNTGPYLQYMGARISSMLRKAPELVVSPEEVDTSRLNQASEWELMSLMGEFPEILASAARDYNPSLIVSYLYDVGKLFSRYYHDNPIITNEDKETAKARLLLARCVLNVLKAGFKLLNIPFLER
ncbi:arginine--tRNA ligase, partial [Spirochaetia bacterium 38H-sp]